LRFPALRPRLIGLAIKGWLRRHPRAPRRFLAAVMVAAALAAAGSRYGGVYVTGWSMAPSVCPGDIAVYDHGICPVQMGDVVLVVPRGHTRGFVHRVVSVGPDGSVSTRGDANTATDTATAAPEEIGGVVVGLVPAGRGVDALVRACVWCYNRLPIAQTRR